MHTRSHAHTHTYARDPEKEHATYADMYTYTRTHALNALELRSRKEQKRVTDKHTYIRARSHALAHDITLLMSSRLCQHDDITLM